MTNLDLRCASVLSVMVVGCAPNVKDAQEAAGTVVHWHVYERATGTTLSQGCALDHFDLDPSFYGRRIQFGAIPGASVIEEMTWEAVTKVEYAPAAFPTDDQYWCGDAGLHSYRKSAFRADQRCIVTADASPPAVIEKIDARAQSSGRTVTLRVEHAGALRLTYDRTCLNLPDSSLISLDVWSELTIE